MTLFHGGAIMSLTNQKVMLETKDLNKKFGDVHAVKNLNFEVKQGEILGFLGPNGAGKTTTMRMITCFIPPTSGAIRVDGIDTRENDLAVREKIGYLPESTPLYNDMMVDEYLRFVGEIRGIRGQKLNSRIDELFAVCGLTKMARRQIGKLSKGYRQRVGLAQALITDPPLLILDEPTSGLDPNQIIEIRNLIKNMGKEKTVLYCSHILSEVSATCNHIIIINQGAIVASGTAEELTAKMKKENRYILRVKADREAVEPKLKSIPGVGRVSVTPSGEWLDAVVVAQDNQDIGEQLYKCIFDNGWSLAELKRESASLEDVFTQLTRG
jgi:ABC-2 type transport system ATP-binding protein